MTFIIAFFNCFDIIIFEDYYLRFFSLFFYVFVQIFI